MVIRNMPGYPSRLASAAGGGFWLSLFGVRTHLVEFVLREDDFRKEMMRTVPPAYWVAPVISSTRDCLEPMQLGGLKALGIEKPWAPPRSYGLLARLDADGEVVETLHSRVGGKNHGITTACRDRAGRCHRVQRQRPRAAAPIGYAPMNEMAVIDRSAEKVSAARRARTGA